MKEFDEILRSDSGYQSVETIIILCILKDFYSGILKLFEGNFHQGIKLYTIYFSLTDINIRTVIILFSIHLPSLHTHIICSYCILIEIRSEFFDLIG